MRHFSLVIVAKDQDGRWMVTKRLLKTPTVVTTYCYAKGSFEKRKNTYLSWVRDIHKEKLIDQENLIENFISENKNYKIDIQMV